MTDQRGGTVADLTGRALRSRSYASFARALGASGCTRCGLAAGRTNIVVDRGSPEAGLMVIGEGPGRDEDLQGRAFVGRAGRLLDRLLAAAGIDTERDTLIANVVKCRPPGNRAPQRAEAAACRPFLTRQLELAAPRTVILLGAVALGLFFPERRGIPLKKQVGRTFASPDHGGVEFAVLYHPAYLLRDPRKQPLFLEQLRKILVTGGALRPG